MKINRNEVAVVVTFSFDPTVNVALFESEEAAVKFIAEDLEREYKIDCEENGWNDITEKWISEDGYVARLINHFSHGEDITEWRIADVYCPEVG